jgi:hypothetical protein
MKGLWTFHHLIHHTQLGEVVLANVFLNGSSSTRKAAPPEESELEPF